ncbi:MAG: VOC family protein [Chloroflexi bacterium]|nr:VOC family protein [Chloroflexota bacterium]
MEIQALVPELLVEDMGRAIDFYTRVLGFHLSAPRRQQCSRPVLQ